MKARLIKPSQLAPAPKPDAKKPVPRRNGPAVNPREKFANLFTKGAK